MIVWCEVEDVVLENDYGREVAGVSVRCPRCGNEEESFGDSDASIRRCLVGLAESCPEDARHFYRAEGDGRE